MPVITRYPTSDTADAGGEAGWTQTTAVDNEADTGSTSYARADTTVNNYRGHFWHGFDFSSIPDSAVINSATVTVSGGVSSSSQSTYEWYTDVWANHSSGSASTELGTAVHYNSGEIPLGSESWTPHTIDISSATVAQLKGSGLAVRLRWVRGSNATARSGRCDYIKIEVDYTEQDTEGTVAVTAAASTASASGVVVATGTSAVTLAAAVVSASGTAPSVVSGTAAVTTAATTTTGDTEVYHTVVQNQTFNSGQSWTGSSYSYRLVKNCTFENITGDGLLLRDLDWVRIENCTFNNITGDGMRGSSNGSTSYVTVKNCTFTNIGRNAITSSQREDNVPPVNHFYWRIYRNYVHTTGTTGAAGLLHGIYLQGSEFDIKWNEVYNTTDGNGISVRSSGNIAHNFVDYAGKSCISYFNDHKTGPSETLTIDSNVAMDGGHWDSSRSEIEFLGPSGSVPTEEYVVKDFYITNNYIYSADGTGIDVDSDLEALAYVTVTQSNNTQVSYATGTAMKFDILEIAGGSASATLASSTTSASGMVGAGGEVSGDVHAFLDDSTVAADGSTVSGTADVALDASTAEAEGSTVSGTVTATADDATAEAEGSQTCVGEGAVTLADATAEAEGTSTGALADITLDDSIIAASGNISLVVFEETDMSVTFGLVAVEVLSLLEISNPSVACVVVATASVNGNFASAALSAILSMEVEEHYLALPVAARKPAKITISWPGN